MRSLLKLLLQVKRCSSGSALVEATLFVPVTISLMVGVVDFGWGFQTWATANKSVRDAARYLGSLPVSVVENTTTHVWVGLPGWATTNAENLAVYGNTAGSGSPLVPGWQKSGGGTNNNVTVVPPSAGTSPPYVISVTAKFP